MTRRDVRVKLQAPADPLIARTLAILKDRIEQRCAVKMVEAGARAHIILTVDDGLPHEAYRIDMAGGAVDGETLTRTEAGLATLLIWDDAHPGKPAPTAATPATFKNLLRLRPSDSSLQPRRFIAR